MPIRYMLLSVSLLFVLSAYAQDKEQPKEPPPIYTYAEQMPSTGYDPGAYLGKNIHYPDSARAHNIQGRVVVKFVVNEDGSISDCKIITSVNKECDEEALRVVKSMPRWKPGTQNGKKVKVYFNLPIVFKL